MTAAAKPRKLLRLLGAFGAGLAFAHAASADIYAYTDDSGAVHFSNVPTDQRFERVIADPAPPQAQARETRIKASAAPTPTRVPYAALVSSAAREHGLPEELLYALITVESNFNPNAVSAKGAVGLTQLMPATAKRMGVKNARDPEQNIAGGARYLRQLLGMFGNDLSVALAAYNAGPNSVVRHGTTIPPYAETRNYVPKVLGLYERYQQASD